MKSLLALFPFSDGLGTSLLLSRVKNLVIGSANANVIPLLQTKTADTAHTGIFASDTRPLSRFWVGPGDEAAFPYCKRRKAGRGLGTRVDPLASSP